MLRYSINSIYYINKFINIFIDINIYFLLSFLFFFSGPVSFDRGPLSRQA